MITQISQRIIRTTSRCEGRRFGPRTFRVAHAPYFHESFVVQHQIVSHLERGDIDHVHVRVFDLTQSRDGAVLLFVQIFHSNTLRRVDGERWDVYHHSPSILYLHVKRGAMVMRRWAMRSRDSLYMGPIVHGLGQTSGHTMKEMHLHNARIYYALICIGASLNRNIHSRARMYFCACDIPISIRIR